MEKKEIQDYVKSLKTAMKGVQVEEGIIHIFHYPIESIKFSKGKDGQLKCTLLDVSI